MSRKKQKLAELGHINRSREAKMSRLMSIKDTLKELVSKRVEIRRAGRPGGREGGGDRFEI